MPRMIEDMFEIDWVSILQRRLAVNRSSDSTELIMFCGL